MTATLTAAPDVIYTREDTRRRAAQIQDQVVLVLAANPDPMTAEQIAGETGFGLTTVLAALIRSSEDRRVTRETVAGDLWWTAPGFGA